MALVECPSCHRGISDEAEACPNCGYPAAKKRAQQAAAREALGCAAALVVIIMIIVGVYFVESGDQSTASAPSAPASRPSGDDTKFISGDHFFGCRERSVYEKLEEYAAEKDTQAFGEALFAELLTGQCRSFQKGEPVFITDTAFFSGLVKVRRKGDIAEYWTVLEAVK